MTPEPAWRGLIVTVRNEPTRRVARHCQEPLEGRYNPWLADDNPVPRQVSARLPQHFLVVKQQGWSEVNAD